MVSKYAVIGCYVLPVLGAARGLAFTYLMLALSLCAYIAEDEFLLTVGLVAQTTINAGWYTLQFVYPTFWPSIMAWWYTVLPAHLVPYLVRFGDLLLHPLPLVLHWPLADKVGWRAVLFAFTLNRIYGLLTDRQLWGCGARVNEIYQFNPPVTYRQMGTAYGVKTCVYVFWIGRIFPPASLPRAVLYACSALGYVSIVFLSKEWDNTAAVKVQSAVNERLWAVWNCVWGMYWKLKYRAAQRVLGKDRAETDKLIEQTKAHLVQCADRVAQWLVELPSPKGAAAMLSLLAVVACAPL